MDQCDAHMIADQHRVNFRRIEWHADFAQFVPLRASEFARLEDSANLRSLLCAQDRAVATK